MDKKSTKTLAAEDPTYAELAEMVSGVIEGNKTSFFDLVVRMRVAQKQYFNSRDKEDLNAAKTLEREVDRLIRDSITPVLFR